MEIPPWTPPWRVVVRDRLIRVSAAHVRGEERWECPTQIAVKARPTLQVDRDPSVRPTYPPFHSFALGLARDAAYAVSDSTLKWMVVIHLTFVISGVLLALMDWLSSKTDKH